MRESCPSVLLALTHLFLESCRWRILSPSHFWPRARPGEPNCPPCQHLCSPSTGDSADRLHPPPSPQSLASAEALTA